MIIHILFFLLATPFMLFSNEQNNHNKFPSNPPKHYTYFIHNISLGNDFIKLIELNNKKMKKFGREKNRVKKICYLLALGVGVELLITYIGKATSTEQYLKIPLQLLSGLYMFGACEAYRSMKKAEKNLDEAREIERQIEKLKLENESYITKYE